MSEVYRSRVLLRGEVIAVLPTWSHGALVRVLGIPDVVVQDGQWIGMSADDAPDVTHRSVRALVTEMGWVRG